MARRSVTPTKVFLMDTSYLLELFRVPGSSKEESHQRVKSLLARAANQGCVLMVQIPCIFKLVDHVGDLDDPTMKANLLEKVISKFFPTSKDGSKGLKLIPEPNEDWRESIRDALAELKGKHVSKDEFGLTNTFTAELVRRLDKKYRSHGYQISIWTRNRDLKKLEPTPESDPFV